MIKYKDHKHVFCLFPQYHLSGPGEAASKRRKKRCYFKHLYTPGSYFMSVPLSFDRTLGSDFVD